MTLLDLSQKLFGSKGNTFTPASMAAVQSDSAAVLYGVAYADSANGEVEVLIDGVVGEGFAEMEDDDHQGSYAAKTIENIETGLGRGGTHKNLSGI